MEGIGGRLKRKSTILVVEGPDLNSTTAAEFSNKKGHCLEGGGVTNSDFGRILGHPTLFL